MSKNTCGECCHLEKAEHFSFQCKHCNGTVSTSNTACSHFSKQYGICPECGSYLFSYAHAEDNDWRLCTCDRCGHSGTPEEFLYNSVFARITVSPMILAKSLVYEELITEEDDGYVYRWRSTILPNDFWYSDEKAIMATLAELKKETNDE